MSKVQLDLPFVGFTGPITVEQVQYILGQCLQFGISKQGSHQPMLGFLVSDQTLEGLESRVTPNRFPNAHPGKRDELYQMIQMCEGNALPVIHYDNVNPDKKGQVWDTISPAMFDLFTDLYGRDLKPGIQLNMDAVDLDSLREFHDQFPDSPIILQLRPTHIFDGDPKEKKYKSPEKIAEYVSQFAPYISAVLFDTSCGGKFDELETDSAAPICAALQEQFPEMVIGAAGKFSDKNTYERIIEMRKGLGNSKFSIDAESWFFMYPNQVYGGIFHRPNVTSYASAAANGFRVNA